MTVNSIRKSDLGIAGLLVAIVVLLSLARSVSYLFFHTLAEILPIVVSLSMFTLTWASNRYLANGYLVVLGGAYGVIGLVDVFHALTFRGMNLFPGVTTNYPTQFWLIARYLEALALLLAPLLIHKRPNFFAVCAGFAVLAGIGCIAVFDKFAPDTFVEGSGLTLFKVISEYIIIGMLLIGFALLTRVKSSFEPRTYFLLTTSLGFAVATEVCFTRYVLFDDFSNETGHYFRFISVALAFIAIVLSGVRRPYEMIFRESNEQKKQLLQMNKDLSISEARYRSLFQNMVEGVAYCKMLYEQGTPQDFIYLEVNAVFEQLTGLKNVVGKRVSELIPRIRQLNPELFDIYGRVAQTGQVESFETFLPTLNTWFKVVVYSLEKEYFVAVFEDITERKKSEELSRSLAFYDGLTGLPNRRMLEDRLQLAIAATKRNRRFGAVLFIDLDNFKPLNDHHGHHFGDLLLIEVARRLISSVRAVDTVARYGGDEFIVILSDLDNQKSEAASMATVVAEKIRVALAAPYVLSIAQEEGMVTVEHRCTSSIGVVLFIGDEENMDGVLKSADDAMYKAKHAGKNQVCCAVVAA